MALNYLQKIDHIIFGVHDLEEGRTYFEKLTGFKANIAGRHPAFGTWNALFRLGENAFFEIIAPDPNRDKKINPSIFGLANLKIPKLIGWMVKEDQIAEKLEKLESINCKMGNLISGKREKPNGELLSWKLSDPSVMVENGAVPYLIDWEDSEHPSKSMERRCELLEFYVYHPKTIRLNQIFKVLEVDTPILESKDVSFSAKISTPKGIISLQ